VESWGAVVESVAESLGTVAESLEALAESLEALAGWLGAVTESWAGGHGVVGGGRGQRRERQVARVQSRMNTDLSSVKASSDLSPSSRPMPDCLYPPNGKVESSSE
jgi:hypothetical protein